MDCFTELKPGNTPCEYSMNYESICGNGTIKILNDNEKIHGLKYLMKNYSNKNYSDTDFKEKILKITTVLELKVNEVVGKSLKK